ncbi:MAG TPA: serine/threonine-protein kinase [Gemmatimonadales bacterium]|nr:serine/threonine-protein kinase [Gemmatimonadales bacterium]
MSTDKICPMCGTVYGPDHVFCPRDSSALRATEEPDDLIGSVIGNRYLVTELIGAGGMGQVYQAQDVRLQRTAAVKVLHAHLARDPAAVARVMREAANGSRIRNPHVVDISDYGETDQGVPYLAMEFIAGESLRATIQREGRLEPRRAATLLGQIARGLDAAHRLGIVHRDLKPDNLLVYRGEDGAELVKIVDFGISRAVQDERQQLTRTGFVTGTCEYMSPEQVAGGDLDQRSDIYALGLVAFMMLTGSLPFSGATPELAMMARLRESPRSLADALPSVRWNPGLQQALDRALAVEASERFDSAGEFARAVGDSVTAPPEPVEPAAVEPAAPRRPGRWRVPAAAGALLLLALGLWRYYPAQPEESGERREAIVLPPTIPPVQAEEDSVVRSTEPADTGPEAYRETSSLEHRDPPPPDTAKRDPVKRDPAKRDPAKRDPVSPAAVAELEAYRDVLRFDLPADSARQLIVALEDLRHRLPTRRDSVEADIYRAEAYALTGDHERACAILESARPYANALQRRKMELWVGEGLCPSEVWKAS